MINSKSKLQLPKRWVDLYAWQLMQLMELEQDKKSYSGYDYLFEQIAILCQLDTDDEILYELTDKDLLDISKELKWLTVETIPKQLILNEFEYEGYKYKKINFNNMLSAEWVTLDYYCKNNYKLYCNHIMAVLYRKVIIDDFGNEKLEYFDYNFEDRCEMFKFLKLDKYPIEQLLQFRSDCFNNYYLSNKEDDDEEKEEDTELISDEILKNETYLDRAKRKDNEQLQKITDTFSWERLSLAYTNNNVVDAYKLLEIPILYLFKMVSMKNHLDNI